jgi:hypothetical protein
MARTNFGTASVLQALSLDTKNRYVLLHVVIDTVFFGAAEVSSQTTQVPEAGPKTWFDRPSLTANHGVSLGAERRGGDQGADLYHFSFLDEIRSDGGRMRNRDFSTSKPRL